VDDWVTVAIGVLAGHPAVTSVEFAGSRSRGTHEELSDWDFAVETSDFDALARDLPALVAPLDPLGQQWEPMGHFPVYQVFLRGPTKIEYLFLDRSQDPLPPLEPSRDTLPAINTHFWDWIWWLTTKASIGRSDLVAEHMPQLYTQLLRPMGISAVPVSIESAVDVFVARRNALEEEFGITVDRGARNRGAPRYRPGSRRPSPAVARLANPAVTPTYRYRAPQAAKAGGHVRRRCRA
jgi:hypothetical protein